jgi:hypothetical protein
LRTLIGGPLREVGLTLTTIPTGLLGLLGLVFDDLGFGAAFSLYVLKIGFNRMDGLVSPRWVSDSRFSNLFAPDGAYLARYGDRLPLPRL